MIPSGAARADWAIATVAFVAAAWLGGTYVRIPVVAANAEYYQETMAPSVMVACGRGLNSAERFRQSEGQGATQLRAFLMREADAFDCSSLPAGLAVEPLNGLQSASLYLLVAVGGVWALTGVSWSALWVLFAALYGAVAVGAFFVFRLGLTRATASLLTIALMVSPVHLTNLPHLRDYSKAPFFLAILLILGHLLKAPVSRRSLYIGSGAAGILMGLAIGVRFDMMLFLVFFAGGVLLFTPRPLLPMAGARLKAIVLSAVLCVIVAIPVLRSFQLGNNSWHVIVLGLAQVHDEGLAIRPASYDLGVQYNDHYAMATVNGFRQLATPAAALARPESREYLDAAGDYFMAAAWLLPADLVVRAWAAVLQLCGLPFRQTPALVPPGWAGAIVYGLMSVRVALAQLLGQVVEFLPLLAAVGIAATNTRLSLFAIATVLFFAGFSSLQFQSRHVFHLEVLPLMLIGLAGEFAVSFVRDRLRHGAGGGAVAAVVTPGAARVALVGVGLVALAVVPVAALRPVQGHRIAALFERYNDAIVPGERPLGLAAPVGMWQFKPVAGNPTGQTKMAAEFLAADFSAASCDYEQASVMVRYEGSETDVDFSWRFDVAIPESRSDYRRVFLPVYRYSEPTEKHYRFVGLELSAAQQGCLQNLRRVSISREFPLLLQGRLLNDRLEGAVFKTLAHWESPPHRLLPGRYAFPQEAQFTKSQLSGPVQLLGYPLEYLAPIADIDAAGVISVGGRPRFTGSYLAQWNATDQPAGALLVVDGELNTGGLAVGLEHDRRWAALVPVSAPGPFRIVIQVPAEARYSPVITSHDASVRMADLVPGRVDFAIRRIGWVR